MGVSKGAERGEETLRDNAKINKEFNRRRDCHEGLNKGGGRKGKEKEVGDDGELRR